MVRLVFVEEPRIRSSGLGRHRQEDGSYSWQRDSSWVCDQSNDIYCRHAHARDRQVQALRLCLHVDWSVADKVEPENTNSDLWQQSSGGHHRDAVGDAKWSQRLGWWQNLWHDTRQERDYSLRLAQHGRRFRLPERVLVWSRHLRSLVQHRLNVAGVSALRYTGHPLDAARHDQTSSGCIRQKRIWSLRDSLQFHEERSASLRTGKRRYQTR